MQSDQIRSPGGLHNHLPISVTSMPFAIVELASRYSLRASQLYMDFVAEYLSCGHALLAGFQAGARKSGNVTPDGTMRLGVDVGCAPDGIAHLDKHFPKVTFCRSGIEDFFNYKNPFGSHLDPKALL